MQIVDLAAHIRSTKRDERSVIFLCGLAGTGKTTVANALVNQHLPGCVVQLDWYLKWPTIVRRRRIAAALASGDAEHLEAEENPVNWYDWERFIADVDTLRSSGSAVVEDAWDQHTGEKSLRIELSVTDRQFVVYEGIYLLHPEVRRHADCTVLLTVDDELARRRADNRDAHRSDAEYLAYKQLLVNKYDVPYMERWSSAADVAVQLTN